MILVLIAFVQLIEILKMIKYPVLFVHKRSNYKKYLDLFDCFDSERNALTFSGTVPVIAHPPCRLWSRLRAFSTAPVEEKNLALWSLELVRKNGGILEHPFDSSFWKTFDCPQVGSFDSFGGTSFVFDQFDFGFYTRKRTRLYIVGLKSLKELPDLPLKFEPVVRKFQNLTAKQRSETTPELCQWFFELISVIQKNKTTEKIPIKSR